jgi:hypothetical protein
MTATETQIVPGTCSVATTDGGVCGKQALKRIAFTARGMTLRAPICPDCKRVFDERKGVGETKTAALDDLFKGLGIR